MPEERLYYPPDPPPVVEAFLRAAPPREGPYISAVVSYATDTARWVCYSVIALFSTVIVVVYASTRVGNALIATPVLVLAGPMMVIPTLWWYRAKRRRVSKLMTHGTATDGEVLRVVSAKVRRQLRHHFRVAIEDAAGRPLRLYFELPGGTAGAEKGDRLAVILEPRERPRYAAVLTPKHGILATRCYNPPS